MTGDGFFFSGVLDEVALYPTALSPAQVANHATLGGASPVTVDFSVASVLGYGGRQDPGSAVIQVFGAGDTLSITGNGWKKVAFPYPVTANTVLEFDFASSVEGGVQGIGFDTDDVLSPDLTFQLFGTQTWGIQGHNLYPEVTHYSIPVGDFYTGDFEYLFFVNDDDVGVTDAVSVFSNVSVYEDSSMSFGSP